MTFANWINVLLSAVATSGITGAVIIWLSREWISARLKGSIQHEYNQKLEVHKAQLKAEHEVAILNIKTALERQATLHSLAHASFAEGQKASMERKLNAVERLWAHWLKLGTSLPPVLGFLDIMTVDEYRGLKDDPKFRALAGDLSHEKITAYVDLSIEQVRPYVGEYMWVVFYCYQAIFLRMLVLMLFGLKDAGKIEWHKDSGIRQLIAAVLTEAEVKEFDKQQFGKISWLRKQLDAKFLGAAQKVISGEGFGADSLKQAQLIQQRVMGLQELARP